MKRLKRHWRHRRLYGKISCMGVRWTGNMSAPTEAVSQMEMDHLHGSEMDRLKRHWRHRSCTEGGTLKLQPHFAQVCPDGSCESDGESAWSSPE
jgi:hypothetical protein